jgi:hypothetical protein
VVRVRAAGSQASWLVHLGGQAKRVEVYVFVMSFLFGFLSDVSFLALSAGFTE